MKPLPLLTTLALVGTLLAQEPPLPPTPVTIHPSTPVVEWIHESGTPPATLTLTTNTSILWYQLPTPRFHPDQLLYLGFDVTNRCLTIVQDGVTNVVELVQLGRAKVPGYQKVEIVAPSQP